MWPQPVINVIKESRAVVQLLLFKRLDSLNVDFSICISKEGKYNLFLLPS